MNFFLSDFAEVAHGRFHAFFAAGTARANEIAGGQEFVIVFPCRKVGYRVRPGDEIKFGPRRIDFFQLVYRVDGVGGAFAFDFDVRHAKAIVSGNRKLDHIVAILFRDVAAENFPRRVARRNENHVRKPKHLARFLRNDQMPHVNGIERPAEDAYPFCHQVNTPSKIAIAAPIASSHSRK